MKLLLVFLNVELRTMVPPNLVALENYVRVRGHDVKVFDASFYKDVIYKDHVTSTEIGNYLNDGIEPNLINEAIKIACINNKKSWGYIKAIVNDSLVKGIKTLKDFNAKEVEFQSQKMKVIQKTTKNSSVPNMDNFEQRQYTAEDFEKYYYKVNE